MTITPPPPPRRGRPGSGDGPEFDLQLPKLSRNAWIAIIVLALPALIGGYIWFVQRKEVKQDHLMVLVRKVGETLPDQGAAAAQVVLYPSLLSELGEDADSSRYKGIVYKTLTEGRYFYDPFFWECINDIPATFIEQDEIGILIRKYGKPLPPGKVVATQPDERGPLAEVLRQGRHNINPFAYDVRRVGPIRIPEGSVGVQTLYSGQFPQNPNAYVVEAGNRGVQPDVLPPGLYFVNPYVREVRPIDVRSHTLDLRDDDAIHFPSKDSFRIVIEGTVEYAIQQERAPYVMAAIGDHEDIRTKLILPYMKSLARIEGSKLEAREFISGDTRKAFQDRVFGGLREQCAEQGIEIRATLIRRIEPPAAIAGPISERQVAEQQITQYQNEIKLAESQARLVEQQEMQKQNEEIGKANREVVTLTLTAEQRKGVAVVEANQRFEVAKLQLEAARANAAAMLARGKADADVVLLNYQAEANPLASAIDAFGSGEAYAQYHFYRKLSPAVRSVLASTDGPLANVFGALTAEPPQQATTERARGERRESLAPELADMLRRTPDTTTTHPPPSEETNVPPPPEPMNGAAPAPAVQPAAEQSESTNTPAADLPATQPAKNNEEVPS